MFKRHDPARTLRVLMADRDYNTNELADKSGMSRDTISRLRSGRTKKPTYQTARAIARALDVKLNTIWPDM